MTRLSANLGYLWPELELLDAIRASHGAGFEAVEVHWPYITHALEVALVLEELGMPIISLNTVGGDLSRGDFGLSAVPGREDEARANIDKAMAYALDISARFVHVLAGKAEGADARATYVSNLGYACERGAEYGVGVLIEPINQHDQPGYHLSRPDDAIEVLDQVGAPNLKILYDCYHVARIDGPDVDRMAAWVEANLDRIGHIQMASVPDRTEPDHGDLDYGALLARIDQTGYEGFVGAEYRPTGRTDEGLDWMNALV